MATLIQILEHVLANTDPTLAVETQRIVLKEVLQAYVLDFLYNHPRYRRLNFYGGTCLHVIYGLNRLSEDLDLDNQVGVNLAHLPADLVDHFRKHLDYPETDVRRQQGAGGILRITLRFPVLHALGLSPHRSERLHLKVEISQHAQVAEIQHTPLLVHGRSLVARHFSLETMMAGKMLACLERNFIRGRREAVVKGRDFYDLLWFMQQRIWPLEEKLRRDGQRPYTVSSAMLALEEKIARIRRDELAVDLLPMFESRPYIEAWLDAFHENFRRLVSFYLEQKRSS